MAEDLGIFNTPRLQYLNLKRNFLAKFLDPRAWGEFGSNEQLISVSALLNFFKEARSLAQSATEHLSEVILENKKLVTEHILPFPPKLYE